MYTFPDNLSLLIRACRDEFSMTFCEVLVSEIGQEHKIPWLLHQQYTREHVPDDIYSNRTIPMEKKKIFLRCRKSFAIVIFALFVSFGFWNHFLSFLFLPSLSFNIHGFVHEPFEYLCCLAYGLLSSDVSRKQFPKENFVYCLWCC